jgi:hypothetical protein
MNPISDKIKQTMAAINKLFGPLKIEIIKMVNERITKRTPPPYRTIIEV